MTVENSEFADLIRRVQEGEEEAARLLYDRFGESIVRAVRRRLHQRLRTLFDTLDFAQDVWQSFFIGSGKGRSIETPEQLAALLTTMARNKVIDKARFHGMQKRDLERETSLAQSPKGGDSLPGADPTPSQIVMGEEAWDQLLATQRPVHKRILLLLRQGRTPETIALELGVSTRMVQRVIQKVLS